MLGLHTVRVRCWRLLPVLLLLFAFALGASLRGWFPWSLGVFATPYLVTIADTGLITEASGFSLISAAARTGGMLDWVSGLVLVAMIVNPRD